MKISGFSMVRNGIKLYYPVVEVIKSILPIVDEFVIQLVKVMKMILPENKLSQSENIR